jgi:hypothetical protein
MMRQLSYGRRKSLFRKPNNALGKHNPAAIERIVTSKYRRGPRFNRQHPFVDVLSSDITESGVDLSVLVRDSGPTALGSTSFLGRRAEPAAEIGFSKARCATLMQRLIPGRTKDSPPRRSGFESCASSTDFRVFQQPASTLCRERGECVAQACAVCDGPRLRQA